MTTNLRSRTTSRIQDASWFPPPLIAQQDTIQFRFVNRDDRSDVKKLIRVFMRQYGMSFPYSEVYDTDFWYTGDRPNELNPDTLFFSCVADRGDNFVAHLGFRCDVANKTVELIFPALDPDYRHLLTDIAQSFWAAMNGLAQRHSWFKVQYFNIASQTAQMIATECFGSHEMALVPNELTPQGRTTRHRSSIGDSAPLLLMYSLLNPKQSPALDLYPPEEHFEAVRDLYAPLGLSRMFRAGNGWVRPTRNGHRPPKLAPDFGPGNQMLDPHFHDTFGVTWVTIEPSRLTNVSFAMDYLEWLGDSLGKQKRKLCVRVALDDVHCPRVSQLLERAGYWFCGIMPLLGARDYILFGRFDPGELLGLELYTPRAQALRNYIVCYYGADKARVVGESQPV